MSDNQTSMGPGKLLLVMVVWVLLAALAYWFFMGSPGSTPPTTPTNPTPTTATDNPPAADPPAASAGPTVTVGIAYGTEKRRWLTRAAEMFAQDHPQRDRIKINLLPMGSLEGAHAVLKGDQRIHVWCPAASLYRRVFEEQWQVQHADAPIVSDTTLALTPMVFVSWQARRDALLSDGETFDFKVVANALAEPQGWQALANQPQWGLFKFGHTHPNQSNSGLVTLLLMGHSHFGKSQSLTLPDLLDPGFQSWVFGMEKAVSGLSNSTGNMMREMVLKGPSAFDAVMVYESVAIDYLRNAEGRWGRIHVDYPKHNMWNDNPYYVLDTPWVDDKHRAAADTFLEFLMSEPVQRMALDHGFRPGNPSVPVRFPESPFTKYADYGLKVDLPQVCDAPSPEVINNLLASWQRHVGR